MTASAGDGVNVMVNPEKPRKGCFEVKVGDDVVIGTCACIFLTSIHLSHKDTHTQDAS